MFCTLFIVCVCVFKLATTTNWHLLSSLHSLFERVCEKDLQRIIIEIECQAKKNVFVVVLIKMLWRVSYILCVRTLMAFECEHAHLHSNKLKQLTHVQSTESVSIQSWSNNNGKQQKISYFQLWGSMIFWRLSSCVHSSLLTIAAGM